MLQEIDKEVPRLILVIKTEGKCIRYVPKVIIGITYSIK
jgi:hypothetical protein